MSFADAKISFNQGEVAIIYGRNLDVGIDKSNGSGKSAILEGIGFGITGSPLREVKNGELVNDDSKEALVRVLMGNDGLNEDMEINRVIYKRKSSVCQVLIGDIGGELIPVDNITSTKEANKFIEAKLGILREDLLNFFILMAAKFTPFLSASDTKKKQVINRFSNGIIVDKSIEALEKDRALCSEDVGDVEAKFSSIKSTLEVLESTLEETERSVDEEMDEEALRDYHLIIDLTTKGTEELKIEVEELKLDIDDIVEEISELKSSKTLIEKRDLIKYDQKKQSELRIELKTQLQEHKHQMNHLKLKIEGSIECPKCDHEFDITDNKVDIDEVREKYYQMGIELSDIIERGKAVRQGIDTYQEKIDTINTKIVRLDGKRSALDEEKIELERDLRKSNDKIESNKIKVSSYELKVEALSNKGTTDVVTPLKNKIEAVRTKFEPINAKMEELEDKMSRYDIQLDIFKRYKSHLANLSLKSMEGLANDFLEDFGSDIFIQLNSTKKLANGQDREKIDSTLVRHGLDIGSFNKLSGGERASINLAFAKTLSHLINLNAGENKGLNLLVIDEILDSTDSEGMVKIVQALERAGETAILITHIGLPASVGNPILVIKENDVSKIGKYEGA